MVLTINGGSSSIKFALFEAGDTLKRILEGVIERIGLPDASLWVKSVNPADSFSRSVKAPDHTVAVEVLMDWIEERGDHEVLAAVGHCVVHGGPRPFITDFPTWRRWSVSTRHFTMTFPVSRSSDMRDLLEHEAQDVRAAEGIALFCYQVKKWIGAFAAASIFVGNKFSFFLIMRSLVR